MSVQPLLQPITVGDLKLKNRVAMAPMTRNRAGEGLVPTDLNAEYYAQRASSGLIISEATQVHPLGVGYPLTPGIHTAAQVAGWKKVTDAVHAKGGKIFLQLWHVGRVSHPSFHNGDLPIAPSAIDPKIDIYTYTGLQKSVAPRAIELSEIPELIAQFRQGAALAKDAGFDGVEVHGANGYVINQFLEDISNQRTDAYGGSVENRARLLFEVLDAVKEVWPENRISVRLSPSGIFNTMGDSNPKALYSHVIERLNHYQLAFLHLMRPMVPIDGFPHLEKDPVATFGPLYQGTLMANAGYTRDEANEAIASGKVHLVSFGQAFLANPDLPQRFELGAPLNAADPSTFYGGDAKGYTDYATLESQKAV
jgi:N-ethylmaleimide reductase